MKNVCKLSVSMKPEIYRFYRTRQYIQKQKLFYENEERRKIMNQSTKATKLAAAVLSTVTVANLVLPSASVFAKEKEDVTPPAAETYKAMKEVKVVLRDENGKKVGETQKVDVEVYETTVPATSIYTPEGYVIVSVGNINNRNYVYATVKKIEDEKPEPEAPKSREISVEYVTTNGDTVATENVNVDYGRLSMTVKAPEGYNLFDTNNVIAIDDSTKTVQVLVVKETVEPEAPKFRFVRVEYKNTAGAIVATERVKVEYGRLTMTVKAPEGYNLADTNNVLSIDDNTDRVEVLVLKAEPKPEGTDWTDIEDNAKPIVKPKDKNEKPAEKPSDKVNKEEAKPADSKENTSTGLATNLFTIFSIMGVSLAGVLGLMATNKKRK